MNDEYYKHGDLIHTKNKVYEIITKSIPGTKPINYYRTNNRLKIALVPHLETIETVLPVLKAVVNGENLTFDLYDQEMGLIEYSPKTNKWGLISL